MLGVDDKAVAAVRRELVATCEISQLKKTVGKDRKARKKHTSRPLVFNSSRERARTKSDRKRVLSDGCEPVS